MEKINFTNGTTPALNATNLNKLQDNVENAIAEQINTQNTTSDSETYSCNYINGIVESGNNTNGYYVKFIDGTLICYGTKGNVTTPANDGKSTLITLPTSFINTNYNVSFTVVNGGAYWANVSTSVNSKNTNNFRMYTWNEAGSDNSNQSFSYIAIGKWK